MKLRYLFTIVLTSLSTTIYGDWELSGTVLTDPETGWAFNVNTSFTYNDGSEDFTGLAIISTKTIGTGAVDFRNKALPEGTTLIALGNGSNTIKNIEELHIPDTVIYIGQNAFNGTTLKKIIPALPDSIRYIGRSAFYRARSFIGDNQGSIKIACGNNPFTWASNAYYDFQYCPITNVTLGANITNIPSGCFDNCTALKTLSFPSEGLKTIAANAFNGCTALETIIPELPSTVNYLGRYAFNNCQKLGSIRIGGSSPFTFDNESGDGRWFFRNYSLSNVTIGAGVTLPSYGKIFEFDGKENSIKTITFEGYPANLNIAFYRERYNYKRHFIVPVESEEWQEYLQSNPYTEWTNLTEEVQEAYFTSFGENATPPSGAFKFIGVSGGNQMTEFITLKKSDTTQSKRLLVAIDLQSAPASTDFSPQLGDYEVTSPPLNCSASYAYDESNTTKYKCIGYELSKYEDESWKLIDSSTSTNFTFNPDSNGYYRLLWKMTPSDYKVEITWPQSLGKIEGINENNSNGFYPINTSITLNAIATNNAPFIKWFGEIDDTQISNSTITLSVDAPKNIIPYFKDNWSYDGENTISDGYFKVRVKGTANALYPQNGDANAIISNIGITEIDLSKPVSNGKIIGLGYKTFRLVSNLEKVFLPKDCEFIQFQTFESSGIKYIDPFLPETITNIGFQAFYRMACENKKLTLGGPVKKVSPLTLDGARIFESLKATELHLKASVNCNIGDEVFKNASALKDIWIEGFPTFNQNAFYGISTLAIRCHIPRGNSEWSSLLSERMVPWDECTETEKNKYWSAFDTTKSSKPPLGKAYIATSGQEMWILKWNPYQIGLILSVR